MVPLACPAGTTHRTAISPPCTGTDLSATVYVSAMVGTHNQRAIKMTMELFVPEGRQSPKYLQNAATVTLDRSRAYWIKGTPSGGGGGRVRLGLAARAAANSGVIDILGDNGSAVLWEGVCLFPLYSMIIRSCNAHRRTHAQVGHGTEPLYERGHGGVFRTLLVLLRVCCTEEIVSKPMMRRTNCRCVNVYAYTRKNGGIYRRTSHSA